MEEASAGKKGNLLSRVFNGVEDAVSFYLTGAIITFLMLFIGLEVLARLILNISIVAVLDVTEVLIIVVALAGLSGTQREDGHVKMDLVLNTLMKGRTGPILQVINSFIGAVFFAALCVFGGRYVYGLYQTGQETLDVFIKIWPFAMALPLGALLIAIRFSIQTKQWIHRARTHEVPIQEEPIIKPEVR
jgi:TRAP-type C4-dicarboxylate transport system permease small subunit